jgi:Flp pilus assembly protein TadG
MGRFAVKARRRLGQDEQGVVAIEFALVAGTLVMAMLSSIDAARFYIAQMEVQNAAQMASQAAWQACDTSQLPATANCPGLTAAVTAAIQSTSLGSKITLQSGSPAEGYYCVNSAGTLQYVANSSSKPVDCSGAGNPSGQPADYIQIKTQYTYAPSFAGFSIASTFPTSITSTAMMRLK